MNEHESSPESPAKEQPGEQFAAPQERDGRTGEAADETLAVAAHAEDWEEDFSHENGKYFNRCVGCGREFLGHKRRVTCKLCGTAVDALGEQPTHFEMARTRMLRKRIADIVATHDAFVAKATKERAEALRHAIDKARGIGLTKAEQEKQEDYDCPHAYPHRYCQTCKVDPCPIGMPPPPERP